MTSTRIERSGTTNDVLCDETYSMSSDNLLGMTPPLFTLARARARYAREHDYSIIVPMGDERKSPNGYRRPCASDSRSMRESNVDCMASMSPSSIACQNSPAPAWSVAARRASMA